MEDYGKNFSPPRLAVTDMDKLEAHLERGSIAPDTRLLTFAVDDVLYTFPMTTVLSYNVIQGQIDGSHPWVMTFCNACNTGMVFNPTLDGRTLHFERRGAFDGLMLIYDHETESYWQHITGDAFFGASAGRRLDQIAPTRHMRADEALSADANTRVLMHVLTPEQNKFARAMERMRATPETMNDTIAATIAVPQEDTRRPRFELGLGIWDEWGSLYVPLLALHNNSNVLTTRQDGRGLVVYQHEDALAPTAVYAETTSARWSGDTLKLDNGTSIRRDRLVMSDGTTTPTGRPMQLLMRWYGFAHTFPGSPILSHV